MLNRKNIITIICLLLTSITHAQLTIEECYTLAKENYPLVKQRELIAKSKEYTIENIAKGYWPQVSIIGSATYQSDVTSLPVTLPGGPIIPKDQYNIHGEVTQTIYDGGILKQQKAQQNANAIIETQKLEVELYKLEERVNQVFFGILMINEQLKQTDLLKKDIQIGIDKTQALVDNGSALQSSVDVLKAELLKSNQRAIELQSAKKAYADMLSLLINKPVNESTVLAKPQELPVLQEINRPELLLYEYQTKSLDIQDKMDNALNTPKLTFFVNGGVGRPALNIFKTDFEPYYIGGLRLNWNLSGFYNNKNNKALVNINRSNIAIQKEIFLFNTHYALKQQNAEIIKMQELLNTDNEIITLRESVKNNSAAKLQYGSIDSNDYLRDVNAEDQARQNKIVHEIQLLLAQYNHQTTTGN